MGAVLDIENTTMRYTRTHFTTWSFLMAVIIGFCLSAPSSTRANDEDAMNELLEMSLDDLLNVDISDMMEESAYTDSFFQYWSSIKSYRMPLSGAMKKARKKKAKPLKLLVYQHDTGQQALSYAVDLLEGGCANFSILVVTDSGQEVFTPQELAYPRDSFDRLPIDRQIILRKYFEENEDTGLWQLSEPEFFADRIQFIEHDSLTDLPKKLASQYRPPYDMISILGSVAEMEKETRIKAKHYWLKVLKKGGVLILHDGKYSAFSGWMDHVWCYNNLLTVNQWVNVKNSDKRKKLSTHKTRYSKKTSQDNYELLNRAYLMAGKQQAAQALTEAYIEHQPLAFVPQIRLLEHLRMAKDKKGYREVIDNLIRTNSDQMTVLGRMLFLQQDVTFIKQLKRAYLDAWKAFQESPEDIDRVINTFAFDEQSASFDILRDILKTRLLLFIQGVYARQNNDSELDALTETISLIINRIHERETDYLIAGKLLAAATKTQVKYYFDHEEYDKALTLAQAGIQTLQTQYNNQNYFYTVEGLGTLHLIIARVHEQKQDWPLVATQAAQSQTYYEQALSCIEEKRPETQWRLLGYLGHSQLLQGQALLHKQVFLEASGLFQQAFKNFEQALEINPQAAGSIAKLRNDLVRLSHEYEEIAELAPLEGWWLDD